MLNACIGKQDVNGTELLLNPIQGICASCRVPNVKGHGFEFQALIVPKVHDALDSGCISTIDHHRGPLSGQRLGSGQPNAPCGACHQSQTARQVKQGAMGCLQNAT
jgi:hypothetical protein